MAQALSQVPPQDDARTLLDRLLSVRIDLGLLSEDCNTAVKRLLVDFPQVFSHIALVGTAHNIARTEKPSEQRSGNISLGKRNNAVTTWARRARG